MNAPHWVVEVNSSADRPLFREEKYQLACVPKGKFVDTLGQEVAYQDPNPALRALHTFGEVHYSSSGHYIMVQAELVECVASKIAIDLMRETGYRALVSGGCRKDLGQPTCPIKPTVINVTRMHIDWGIPCSKYRGPIARALRDVLGFKCTASTDQIHLYPNGRDSLISLQMTDELKNFVEKFDYGEPVEPFSFELMWSA